MYEWIVALHIVSFVSWMAMLFYLPRLFIYHVENRDNSGFIGVVKVQEEKLYKYIGVPALWLTLLSGASLLMQNSGLFGTGGWLHLKLTLVALLVAYHFSLGHFRKQLLEDRCTKSSKFFRYYNEVPTILLIVIVIMVIVKPF